MKQKEGLSNQSIPKKTRIPLVQNDKDKKAFPEGTL